MASPLKNAGYDVKIIDASSSIQEIFKNMERVICVGISALTGNEIAEGVNFAKQIKNKFPYIPVVWGGWHVSILSEESMKSDNVDIVCYRSHVDPTAGSVSKPSPLQTTKKFLLRNGNLKTLNPHRRLL